MCTYNSISSHTDHFKIQKRDSEEKSIDFSKSVSQFFFDRTEIVCWQTST